MSSPPSTSFHDPTSTSPRATPAIPDGGFFSIYSATTISTPPQYVYDAILDLSHWPEWNTFVPDVKLTKQPSASTRMEQGSHMTFSVHMVEDKPLTTSKEVVTLVEPLKTKKGVEAGGDEEGDGGITRICWALDNSGMLGPPAFVLKAERVNEIEQGEEEGQTVYRTWETFAGLAAGVVRWKFAEVLQGRFEEWSGDLKKRAEELYAKDKRSS